MKRFIGSALMLVLLAAPAFGSMKPQTVIIPENVQVGSTQLPAGTYKLAWTGSGSNVQATLTQDGKAVVTFSARAVEGKNNPGVDIYTHGGVVNLEAIYLSSISLALEGAPKPGQ